MNAVFFIGLTLFLIVLQTIVLPSFSWFVQCFDLLIIVVLFLSLISSHFSMVFAIVMIGSVMDSISGVPFCFYTFSYLWSYIIVHLAKQMLFKQSIIFILIVSLLSVVIQQGLLLLSVFVSHGSSAVLDFNFGLLIRQVFWGFVFIPPGIWLTNICWQNWRFLIKFLQKQFVQQSRG